MREIMEVIQGYCLAFLFVCVGMGFFIYAVSGPVPAQHCTVMDLGSDPQAGGATNAAE